MHPYVQAVLDSGPQNYWPYGSDGAPLAGPETVASTNVVFGAAGPLLHGDLGAAQFDGNSSAGQVFVPLGGIPLITVEFFLYWEGVAENDKFAMEHSANANSNTGFNFDWNNSSAGPETNCVSLKANWGLGSGRWYFPRPAADSWHHVMAVIRAGREPAPVVFIDGVSKEVGVGDIPSENEAFFGDTNLNLMSRNGVALNGAGRMAHVAIYTSDVSADLPAHIAAITAEEGEPEPPEEGWEDARIGWEPETDHTYYHNVGATN